jgi:hypothetical protein
LGEDRSISELQKKEQSDFLFAFVFFPFLSLLSFVCFLFWKSTDVYDDQALPPNNTFSFNKPSTQYTLLPARGADILERGTALTSADASDPSTPPSPILTSAF